MPRPRVHVVPDTADLARPNACAALRLLDPYASIAVADVADVTFGLAPEPCDTLVLQRLARGADAAALVRANGPRLIYDLDDNLLDPHPDPATEAELAPHRPQIRTLLRFADQVTVSTPALAARVAGLNPRVRVLSNALDDHRFPEPRPRAPNGRLHIGYYGTFTHLADLMRVAGPTRAALAQLPSPPRLTFCGVSTDPRLPALFAGLATVDLLAATADYPSFIEQMRQQPWDFALAPLADSPFTAAKSDIKYLEQAAFGIPGLYAAHSAYAAVQDSVTGLVAAPDRWTGALLRLATDPDLRTDLALAAAHDVRTTRTLARCGAAWAAVLRPA